MNKEGNNKVKNYRSGKAVRFVSTVLVCTAIAGSIATLPVFNGESLFNKVYNMQEKSYLEQRAKNGLPIELEKGIKSGIITLEAGTESNVDFDKIKELYKYNPDTKSGIRISYNSAIYYTSGCEIIEEDGVLMISPISKSKETTSNLTHVLMKEKK